MEALIEEFIQACEKQTDINKHLPMLHGIANLCDSVTEFGVRDGQSTRALLASRALKVRSYDLYLDPNVSRLFIAAQQFADRDAVYTQGNSLFIDIDQTDLLFIDTDHKYSQLKQELEKHHTKVNKYLAFHDTQTYGTNCQDGKGLLPAILEFMMEHREWVVNYHSTENNGFTVLEKTS